MSKLRAGRDADQRDLRDEATAAFAWQALSNSDSIDSTSDEFSIFSIHLVGLGLGF